MFLKSLFVSLLTLWPRTCLFILAMGTYEDK